MERLFNEYQELINAYNGKLSEADQILYKIAEKSLEIQLQRNFNEENAIWN